MDGWNEGGREGSRRDGSMRLCANRDEGQFISTHLNTFRVIDSLNYYTYLLKRT